MAAVANPATLFERTMENLDLPKSDMNKLVMDYLITEGYPSAAERFAMEANIELNTDQSYIRERVHIRDLILQGDIQQAIESINDLDSELLDKDKKLHFSLLRLQLVEMIKQSFINSDQALIGSAIEFAQHNLAPYTPLDASFKNDLERAMALLIIPKETWMNPQAAGDFGALAELVHPDLRLETAKNVNMSILNSRGLRKEPNINYLVKARAWSEAQAREKKIPLPDKLGLGLEGDGSRQSGNGHDGDDTEMAENGSATGSTGENDLARYTNIPS